MTRNYHHPEARQMSGRSFGLAPVVDRLSELALATARPIEWHTHAETEILCCLKGSLEYEFENHANVSLHPSCYLTVPAGVRHRLTGGMDGPCRRLSFYLKPARAHLGGLVPFTSREYGGMLSDILKKSFKPKAFSPSVNISRIADLTDSRSLTSRERIELRVLVVHALLYFASTTAPVHAAPKTKIIEESIRWLEAHYAERITIDQLTTFMGYGKSRLFSLFKDLTGLSPIDYLNRHRINKATTLLAETDKPVFQIARMVGFENPTFFTKLFHRYMGTTPSQCRTPPL